MKFSRTIVFPVFMVLLMSCSTQKQAEEDARLAQEAALAEQIRQEQIAQEEAEEARLADLESQQAIREAARKEAEALRLEEEARRQEELARQEANRRAREESARQAAEAQRQAALAEQARQEARISELQAQIAENESRASELDAANAVMRETVQAAANLSSALSAEQEKFANIDPATGETTEALATSTLDELKAEVERLQQEAAAIQSQ